MNKYRKRRELSEKRFVRGAILTLIVIVVATAASQAAKNEQSFSEFLTNTKKTYNSYKFDPHKRIKEISTAQIGYGFSMSNEIVNKYMKDLGVSENWHIVFIDNKPYLVDLSTSLLINNNPFSDANMTEMEYNAKIYRLDNLNTQKIEEIHDFWEAVETMRSYTTGSAPVTDTKARTSLEDLIKFLDVDPIQFLNYTVTKDVGDEFILESKNNAKENLNKLFGGLTFVNDCKATIGLSTTGTRESHALQDIVHNQFKLFTNQDQSLEK